MKSKIKKAWVIWGVTASLWGAGFLQLAFGQNCTGAIQMFNNQLNVTVDLLHSHIVISGFDCDPCVTGISFQQCRAIQSCYQECEYLIPPQPDYGDIIDNCLVSCQGEPDPYVYYDCVRYCQELPLEAHNNCLVQNGCQHLNRVRIPVAYTVAARFWFITGFGIPDVSGSPNRIIHLRELLDGLRKV